MKEIEQTGKTVEKAMESAINELGVSPDDVQVEVVEKPGKGLLNILSPKLAKIKVRLKNESALKTRKIIEDILKLINLEAAIEIKEAGTEITVDIWGEEMGLLIGRHGSTLNALQFLLNVIVNKGLTQKSRITLDIEGYREKRKKSLQNLADKMARKARLEKKSINLEPMLPYERKIIHVALQNNPHVSTYSQGDEPKRRVVISPKVTKKTYREIPKVHQL